MRTYSFLDSSGQLYQGQYGFRSEHSCQRAISELIGTIAKNTEEKKFTMGVFIDLSKAFDNLSHKILLAKMSKYGIRGDILHWFEDYLDNRKMRVKCMTSNGKLEYSTYHKLDFGTPQGSCLGPLLFLIFINDLPQCNTHGISLLFADDTTLLHSHSKLNELKKQVENDLGYLIDWFRANKLTLNLGKTVMVLFGTVTLSLDSHTLQCSDNVKFLGMWLDNKLNNGKNTLPHYLSN